MTIVITEKVSDRMTVLAEMARNAAQIADLGCVDARPGKELSGSRLERKPNSLHRKLLAINPDIVGIDQDEEGIAALARQGYHVLCADVETMELTQRFDLIVAGELIEHLENPGRFLRNLHRHLKPAGQLVLTTPNPFYAAQRYKIWRRGAPSVHEDHTCWFDPKTLGQLLERTGYKVTRTSWIQPRRALLKTWPVKVRPYFAHSFLMAATPSEDDH